MSSTLLCVHYGCGICGPSDWLNFDASPWIKIQRIPIINQLPGIRSHVKYPSTVHFGNVLRGLPVKNDAADLAYCSHTLEHLTLEDCRIALRETYRFLKPGGVFRAVQPDLRWICERFLACDGPESVSQFMQSSLLGVRKNKSGLAWWRDLFSRDAHFWLWDYQSIMPELLAVGFKSVRRAHIHDNPHPAFLSVEDANRWENCLGIEAIK